LDEITDLGNDAHCTVHGVRAILLNWGLRAGQFRFCCPLAKHKTGEWNIQDITADAFHKNISFRGLTTCVFVPMVLQAWWEPKWLH